MSKIRNGIDEIIHEYCKLIDASMSNDINHSKELTEKEYKDLQSGVYTTSGESEWKTDKVDAPSTAPMAGKWVYDWATRARPGEPETIPPVLPEPKIYGPNESMEGESEWYNPEEEYDREEEIARQIDSDIPEEDSAEHKYNEQEYDEPKYNDEEYMEMIAKDPIYVTTHLRLQHDKPYSDVKYVAPLLKSLLDVISDGKLNESLKEGSILYNEIKYMTNILKSMSEKLKKPQVGKTEWSPE